MLTIHDNAILLSARRHGETSAIVRMLTLSHGLYHGVARGAFSKANRGVYQSGNIISATWSARISEHMGAIKGELVAPNAAHIMQDALALSVLSSLCALLVAALPERHPYPKLYASAHELLQLLQAGDKAHYLTAYAEFELLLLAETGFGLDLTACAATGETEDLIYVSPKSGRAVSRAAGEPYRDKLLKLPDLFLRQPGESQDPANLPVDVNFRRYDIHSALTLTGYFLEHWLFGAHNKKIPSARNVLLSAIEK